MKNLNYNLSIAALLLVGCVGSSPGPDKHGGGMMQGAALGAGAGAVTGAQVTAATGPGVLVGAGLGAVAGGVRGALLDTQEEEQLRLQAEIEYQRDRARAHQILHDHYVKRLEMHPTRDIYPADLFFFGDDVKLMDSAIPLVEEIANLNKERLPYSRFAVIAYAKAVNEDSTYAQFLAERRSKAITNELVRFGLEPRRIESRGVVINVPLLIDPDDDYFRYGQAIELLPIDR